MDVLVLEELFIKTENALWKIGVDLTSNPTIGSSSMDMFRKSLEKREDKISIDI
jgi:hypothetical protein